MADVEASTQRSGSVNNPYSGGQAPVLPHWHPMNVASRCLYMGVPLYILDRFKAYDALMKNPQIRHEWFKIGLAGVIGELRTRIFFEEIVCCGHNVLDILICIFIFLSAILFVKSYVEMYAGKLKHQKVNYKNFRQSTHTVMLLILLSSIAFNIALWPVYGGNSMFIMFLVGCVILNFCLLFPTYVQNLTAFAILAFFLQEYK